MTKVSLHRMLSEITMTSDREFYLSTYMYWLKQNVSERGMAWWLDKGTFNGRVDAISFVEATDATAFKLKFGL